MASNTPKQSTSDSMTSGFSVNLQTLWCAKFAYSWPETPSRWTVVGESTVSSVSLNTRNALTSVQIADELEIALWTKKVSLHCSSFLTNLLYFHQKLFILGDRDIKALRVKCTHHKDGCKWENELSCLVDHLKSCDFKQVPCDNQCKVEDKPARILRKDMAKHLASECPRRQYECPHCHQKGEYQEMVGPHLDTCPNVSTDCPNEGCHKRFPRISAAGHATVCDYQPVACKYAEVGCTERVLRKDLKEHEKDDQFHLQLTTENVLQLKQDVTRMEARLSKLEHTQSTHTQKMDSRIDKLEHKQLDHINKTDSRFNNLEQERYTFKARQFEKKKRNDDYFFSPQYYIKGYKMKFEVWVNGDESKGTHVSVYVYLTTGKYDKFINWPFDGTITIEILNQLEDKNHYSKSLTFSADDDASNSLEKGSGWGYTKFIAHSELSYKAGKNCQYLKDDCLVFRVSATLSDDKPWLDVSVVPGETINYGTSIVVH